MKLKLIIILLSAQVILIPNSEALSSEPIPSLITCFEETNGGDTHVIQVDTAKKVVELLVLQKKINLVDNVPQPSDEELYYLNSLAKYAIKDPGIAYPISIESIKTAIAEEGRTAELYFNIESTLDSLNRLEASHDISDKPTYKLISDSENVGIKVNVNIVNQKFTTDHYTFSCYDSSPE